MVGLHCFYGQGILGCTYVSDTFFPQPSADGQFGCFRALAVVYEMSFVVSCCSVFLKSVLSEISIATPVFCPFHLHGISPSIPFLSVSVSLDLKWVLLGFVCSVQPPCVTFFNPHLKTCLLILEKREGREKHHYKRETSMGCLSYESWLGTEPKPGHVPWPGTEPLTFLFILQPPEPHRPGPSVFWLEH